MRRFLKEPVFHFAIMGLALFAYFKLADEEAQKPGDTEIQITEEDAERLIRQYGDTWGRFPRPEELSALIDSMVREEILVREALSLGLDRGDATIRNRLQQKMQFLTESAAHALEPDDLTLQEHLEENADRFRKPPSVAFIQVYLGEKPTIQQVTEIRSALDAGEDPATLGQPTMLPVQVPPARQAQVDGSFGNGVFAAIVAQPVGEWSEPLQSGFGWHLVKLTDLDEGSLPLLEELRDKVLFDWRRVQADTLAELQYQALSKSYQVSVPDDQALQQLVAQ
ncbi:peptidyl-prolyl cis-trans isomerase [Primorskyibacter sp. S87]|uniref:peptidylprolyl isomerase n=1 Tax=Primorskyibacter sp. S87 TaxID=3415126 RepID=UPI003C7CFDB0